METEDGWTVIPTDEEIYYTARIESLERKLAVEVECSRNLQTNLDAAERKLRVAEGFVSDIAEGDCSYNDQCPPTARHYQCHSCKARAALVVIREPARKE